MEFCSCEDWKRIRENNPEVFHYDDTYNWLINWIELTKEGGYTKVHRYGIGIKYCPMCGKKLKNKGE